MGDFDWKRSQRFGGRSGDVSAVGIESPSVTGANELLLSVSPGDGAAFVRASGGQRLETGRAPRQTANVSGIAIGQFDGFPLAGLEVSNFADRDRGRVDEFDGKREERDRGCHDRQPHQKLAAGELFVHTE